MNPKTFSRAVVLSLFLGLAACSTPESRIGKNQAAFDSYPADVQAKIRAKQVDVGFTAEQVLMALGEPDHRSTRTDAKGSAEVWGYRDRKPRISLGIGVGGGGGGTSVGAGVGVSSDDGYRDDVLRVILRDGKVSAVERTTR